MTTPVTSTSLVLQNIRRGQDTPEGSSIPCEAEETEPSYTKPGVDKLQLVSHMQLFGYVLFQKFADRPLEEPVLSLTTI